MIIIDITIRCYITLALTLAFVLPDYGTHVMKHAGVMF